MNPRVVGRSLPPSPAASSTSTARCGAARGRCWPRLSSSAGSS